MSIFEDLEELVVNTTKIAIAPAEIVVHIANESIKPIADLTKEVVKDIKDAV